MKKIFPFTLPQFDFEILVCVGAKADDVKRWIDKSGGKDLKSAFDNEVKKDFEKATKNGGFILCFEKDLLYYYFLWLDKWDFSWTDLDILNHEIVHLRQYIFKNKKIENEFEFEAYFQEVIFKTLRNRLNKEFKIK